MENQKKTHLLGILIVFTILFITIVSSQVIVAEDISFWEHIKYKLQELGLFTAVGQARDCSTTPDYTYNNALNGVAYSKSSMMSNAGCSKSALFNVFDSSWTFKGEYLSEEIGQGLTLTFNGKIEVYCCPYSPCNRNSDCNDPHGDTCSQTYGSCYYNDLPTHKTTIYKCNNGDWDSQGSVSYGDSKWCASSSAEHYIRQGDVIGGCYSSPPSGWCIADIPDPTPKVCANEGDSCVAGGSTTTPDCCSGLDCQYFQCIDTGGKQLCSNGDQVCGSTGTGGADIPGEIVYKCLNNNWISQGRIDGSCGYTRDSGKILDAVIYDIESPASVGEGDPVTVSFKIKNKGSEGNYLIEAGIIPKSTAKNWGFSYAGGGYGILDWLGLSSNALECCAGQPNIFAKSIPNFATDEINEFKIKIPKAPFPTIADLCYDNNYYDSNDSYVLYITMKTGCYPDGEEVTYETQLITIGGVGGVGGVENVSNRIGKSLTWGDFFSMSDKDYAKKGLICYAGEKCPSNKDYNIVCDTDEILTERVSDMIYEQCDDKLGWFNEIVAFVGNIGLLGAGETDLCKLNQNDFDKYIVEKKIGVCMAESTSTIGGLWEGILRMVGGMGLPPQYVLIATIMFLIIIIGMGARMFIK